jgi:ABC-2 type transport system permease protein
MTTMMTFPRAAATAAEPRARFRDLLAAEWIKLWSLRSTSWVFALSALAIIALNANAAIADYANWPGYSARTRALFEPGGAMQDAFTRNACLVLMLAAASIGAIMIVSEYSTGLIRTTFAAVPARRSVVAAKMAIATGVFLVFGAIVSVISFGVTQAILSGRHIGLSIGDPGVLRVLAASALFAPVCALIGIGIGALIRHTATTMVAITVVLLLVPFFVSDHRRWTADIDHAMPYSAWQRLVELHAFGPAWHGATITGSWTVFAVWPLVAAIIAMAVVQRRDL